MNYQFRKKPVVIEAFQMTFARRLDNSDWPAWLHTAWNYERGETGGVQPTIKGSPDSTLAIMTLEGEHIVAWDDWIIQGVKGELYPCKPDVFEMTYEVPATVAIAEAKAAQGALSQ